MLKRHGLHAVEPSLRHNVGAVCRVRDGHPVHRVAAAVRFDAWALRSVRCRQRLQRRSSAGYACEPTTYTCVASCADAGRCPPSAPLCSQPRGVCVDCTDSQDCSGGRMNEVCDQAIGQCVECSSDLQCPDNQSCDRTTDRCVGCLTSLDCTRDQVCDPNTQACVGSMGADR